MGNLNLNSSLGFYREIVKPNFEDFYWDYQSDDVCDVNKLTRVFRKMVNLALTLNHVADKVARQLNYENANLLIKEVTIHYPREGNALNAVRLFSNDVKHKAKLDSNYAVRKRNEYDQPLEGTDLPEWYFIDASSRQKVAICDATVVSSIFWGKWFALERNKLPKHT